DFGDGNDKIDLTDFNLANGFDDLAGMISYAGGDAVIDFGTGQSITLLGVADGDLSASDFLF
ncbi:MAG: hypothetical protein KDA49_13580, partial [Rhodospirillaceae bacterium]|nr:hypothetical protein [Rhodospirillaceae bacterium]